MCVNLMIFVVLCIFLVEKVMFYLVHLLVGFTMLVCWKDGLGNNGGLAAFVF